MRKIITSESVNCGHPDKTCDIIADSFLDEALKQDPNSMMAVECAIKDNKVFVYGEATTKAKANIKGQHLSLVFASSPSHILSFTTEGNYSNIGGSTGNRVQEYHWLKNQQGIKYFSLDVMLYKSKPIIKSDE